MPHLVYASEAEFPFPKNTVVRDAAGREGLLAAVLITTTPFGRETRRTAFLRPAGGGCEWEVDVADLEPAHTPPAAAGRRRR